MGAAASSYAGFIAAAYGIAGLLLGGLILESLLAFRAAKARLAAAERALGRVPEEGP